MVLQAPPASELPVWGDQIRLQQILQNLLTNAIHYTPAGGSITVNSRVEAGAALVRVRDTGCGIAPEDQAAVFDRYFHTTTSSKHDSTGLGLTIAQELAHLHHGEILLESEVGKGSCFTLKLPYYPLNREIPAYGEGFLYSILFKFKPAGPTASWAGAPDPAGRAGHRSAGSCGR